MKNDNWSSWERAISDVAGVGEENAMPVDNFKRAVAQKLRINGPIEITVEDLAWLAENGLPLRSVKEDGKSMCYLISNEAEKDAYLDLLYTMVRTINETMKALNEPDTETPYYIKSLIRLENAIRKIEV